MLRFIDLDGRLVLIKASFIFFVARHNSSVSEVTKTTYPERTAIHIQGGQIVWVKDSVEAVQSAIEATIL